MRFWLLKRKLKEKCFLPVILDSCSSPNYVIQGHHHQRFEIYEAQIKLICTGVLPWLALIFALNACLIWFGNYHRTLFTHVSAWLNINRDKVQWKGKHSLYKYLINQYFFVFWTLTDLEWTWHDIPLFEL